MVTITGTPAAEKNDATLPRGTSKCGETASSGRPCINSSRLREALPNVPTSKESGFPQFEVNSWYSVAAPANTPKDIVARLNTEIARAMRVPAVREKLIAEGLEPRTSTPEEMTDYVKAEYERWGKVVKTAGIKPG